jgi:TraB/PrgY/gumN family
LERTNSCFTKIGSNQTKRYEIPVEEFIEFVNRLPDSLLLITLPGMLLPMEDVMPQRNRTEIGFLKKIHLEQDIKYLIKHNAIERPEEIDSFWTKNCGQVEDTELMVREILKATGPNVKKTVEAMQAVGSEFKNNAGTAELMTKRLQNAPLWKILDECSVHPRNLEWMKKIKYELDKDTQPLMIVVGIGHVVGETGLLSLLCKEGYCNARKLQKTDLSIKK